MPLAAIVAHWMTSWPVGPPVTPDVWTGLGVSEILHHSDSQIRVNSEREIRRNTTRRTTTRR